jgi:hypothetical protein
MSVGPAVCGIGSHPPRLASHGDGDSSPFERAIPIRPQREVQGDPKPAASVPQLRVVTEGKAVVLSTTRAVRIEVRQARFQQTSALGTVTGRVVSPVWSKPVGQQAQ